MAATKRTKFEREQQLVQIAQLYLTGHTQAAIARQLNLSRSQIQYDIQACIREWRRTRIEDIDQVKTVELERINRMECEYWDAWERSKLDRKSTSAKRVEDVDGTRTEAQKRAEGQTGNPAYLAGVQWCIEQRCKILGLYAPVKTDGTLTVNTFAEAMRALVAAEDGAQDTPDAPAG
jgi:hypothetical protein